MDMKWCEKYESFMIQKDKIKAGTIYWVCDVDMAVGDTQDNVFQYDFSYKGKIIKNGAYIAFKSKKKAIEFSKELRVNEIKFTSK